MTDISVFYHHTVCTLLLVRTDNYCSSLVACSSCSYQGLSYLPHHPDSRNYAASDYCQTLPLFEIKNVAQTTSAIHATPKLYSIDYPTQQEQVPCYI